MCWRCGVSSSTMRGWRSFMEERELGGRPARLWQGESQVEAPVLEFEQRERRMVAHGDGREAGMVVHAVFVSAASPDSGR